MDCYNFRCVYFAFTELRNQMKVFMAIFLGIEMVGGSSGKSHKEYSRSAMSLINAIGVPLTEQTPQGRKLVPERRPFEELHSALDGLRDTKSPAEELRKNEEEVALLKEIMNDLEAFENSKSDEMTIEEAANEFSSKNLRDLELSRVQNQLADLRRRAHNLAQDTKKVHVQVPSVRKPTSDYPDDFHFNE